MLIDGVYTIGRFRVAFWDGNVSKGWRKSPFGIMVMYGDRTLFKMLDGEIYD